jgi:iron complex outermembrane receptor protein
MSSNIIFQKKTLALAIGSVIAGHAPNAGAQEEGAEKGVLEEIVVTATRRETSVLDIPYNVSAVSGEEIAGQNIVDATDLMRLIPGVSVVDRGYRNSGMVNSMIIRGVNVDNGVNGDVGLSSVAPVATYVDNTPIFANFLLKDIQRVEVLRGPQGTLYGSGSLGGTVRYIMNRPDAEAFDASVSAGYSQTDGSDGSNYTVDGMVNIPLGDTLAFRVSAGVVSNSGIIDYKNLYVLDGGDPVVLNDAGDCVGVTDPSLTDTEIAFNGSCYRTQKDADEVDISYARASLRFDPSDNLNLQLNYQMQDDEIGARRAVTVGADYYGNAYNGTDEIGSTMLEPSTREVSLASLDIEWDLGFATMTSNSSVYDNKGEGWRDNTSLWVTDRGGFANWFDILYTGNPRPVANVSAGYDESAFVQEFRLVSNPSDSSRFDWVVGLYYMDQDREVNNFSYLLGLDEYSQACAAIGPACEADGQWWVGLPLQEIDFYYIRQENFTDLAAYGELTWHLTDTVHITGGLRWFDNELTNNTAIDFPLVEGQEVPFVEYPSQKEDDIQLKLNVAWDISDTMMAYATYSEGFRRGGANAIPDSGFFAETNPESVRFYKADTVQNYELGLKGGTDRIRYAADIYYVDWKDPQLNTATADWGFFMAQNGEAAKTTGVELEAQVLLTDDLEMNLGYAYVNAELAADLYSPQYGSLLATSGHRLPGTAENVVTAALTHSTTFSGQYNLVSRLSAYYQSDSINSVQDNTLQDTFGGFTIWNASVAVQRDNWDVSLYMRNIANEQGVTGSYPSAYMSTDTGVFENYYGNNQRTYITTPRTLGVRVSYNF